MGADPAARRSKRSPSSGAGGTRPGSRLALGWYPAAMGTVVSGWAAYPARYHAAGAGRRVVHHRRERFDTKTNFAGEKSLDRGRSGWKFDVHSRERDLGGAIDSRKHQ